MRLIAICLIVLLVAFGVFLEVEGKSFRCDYTYFKDIDGWMKMHLIPETWRDARLRCHLEGANLASPLNADFGMVMMSMMVQTDNLKRGIFTGIHSQFSKGAYHSIQNIPLLKIPHKWAEGEPNNINNNEDCIMMLPSGEILDRSCKETYPYICYKENKNEVVNNCGTIDNEYSLDTRTGKCYKFHRVPRTWKKAFKACSAEGGHLAIINNDVEAQVIVSIFAKNLPYTMIGNFWKDVAFMGLHDWGEHGEFLTIEVNLSSTSYDSLTAPKFTWESIKSHVCEHNARPIDTVSAFCVHPELYVRKLVGTVGGQTLNEAGYSKFSGGEPNNSTTGEYCGSVYRNGMYNDLWCENSYAAICEMTPNSLCVDKHR